MVQKNGQWLQTKRSKEGLTLDGFYGAAFCSRVGPASVALSPPSPGPVAPGRQMNEERRKVRVFGPGLSLAQERGCSIG